MTIAFLLVSACLWLMVGGYLFQLLYQALIANHVISSANKLIFFEALWATMAILTIAGQGPQAILSLIAAAPIAFSQISLIKKNPHMNIRPEDILRHIGVMIKENTQRFFNRRVQRRN